MVVQAHISFTSGAVTVERAGVIVNYKDSNNYLYVQYESVFSTFSGSPIGTSLKFFRRSGGVSTQLGTTKTLDALNGTTLQTARVCYDGVYLKASGYIEAADPIVDGYRSGVFSNGSSAIYFNDFKIYNYEMQCPNCDITRYCPYCLVNKQPKTAIILDLGAGGLVDGSCNNCDQVRGEYTLIGAQEGTICQYRFTQFPICNVTGPLVPIMGKLDMIAYIVQLSDLSATQWVAIIEVTAQNPTGSPFILGSYKYQALYSGLLTTNYHCDETPVTLTRYGSTHFTSPFLSSLCTGDLPATIELRQP
jgi:hypothetical protein